MKKFLNLKYGKNTYKIETKKILYILTLLENKCLDNCKDENVVISLMEKFQLFDKAFLNKINEI